MPDMTHPSEGLSNEMKIMKQQVFDALWSAYEKQQECFFTMSDNQK